VVPASSDVLDTLAEPDSKSESCNRQPAVVLAAANLCAATRVVLDAPLRATTAPIARAGTEEWLPPGAEQKNCVKQEDKMLSNQIP
jgi:hypothetical protein